MKSLEKAPWPQMRRLVKEDGTIAWTWDNKLHNWDGPALIPEGNKKNAEYYIYGIHKTKGEWDEAKKDWEGLPWYKNPSMKAFLDDGYRN